MKEIKALATIFILVLASGVKSEETKLTTAATDNYNDNLTLTEEDNKYTFEVKLYEKLAEIQEEVCIKKHSLILQQLPIAQQKIYYNCYLKERENVDSDKCISQECFEKFFPLTATASAADIANYLTSNSKTIRNSLKCYLNALTVLSKSKGVSEAANKFISTLNNATASTNSCYAEFLLSLLKALYSRYRYFLMGTNQQDDNAERNTEDQILEFTTWTEAEIAQITEDYLKFAECYTVLVDSYNKVIPGILSEISQIPVCAPPALRELSKKQEAKKKQEEFKSKKKGNMKGALLEVTVSAYVDLTVEIEIMKKKDSVTANVAVIIQSAQENPTSAPQCNINSFLSRKLEKDHSNLVKKYFKKNVKLTCKNDHLIVLTNIPNWKGLRFLQEGQINYEGDGSAGNIYCGGDCEECKEGPVQWKKKKNVPQTFFIAVGLSQGTPLKMIYVKHDKDTKPVYQLMSGDDKDTCKQSSAVISKCQKEIYNHLFAKPAAETPTDDTKPLDPVDSATTEQIDCKDICPWNESIAFGKVAPWKYDTSDKVTVDGVAYQAMWGGQDKPGVKLCSTQSECQHNGYQWMTLGECIPTTVSDCVVNHVPTEYDCTAYPAWDIEIAQSKKHPWTYRKSDKVTHGGYVYYAIFDGPSEPGVKICYTDEECSHNGYQWVQAGICSGTTGGNNGGEQQIDCDGLGEWTTETITYPTGETVQYFGKVFTAVKDGNEVPGSDPCSTPCTEQWTKTAHCLTEGEVNADKVDCSSYNEWSQEVASGKIDPFKYVKGDTVKYNFDVYVAESDGTQTPGIANCPIPDPDPEPEPECTKQWDLLGDCNAEGEPDPSKHDCTTDYTAWVEGTEYEANVQVHHEGKAYKSVIKGKQTPGTDPCTTTDPVEECKAQWVFNKDCLAEGEDDANKVDCSSNDVWDSAVTYSLGTQVQHEGKQYYAQKDGTETPGTDPCTTTDPVEECKAQWVFNKDCLAEGEDDANKVDCSSNEVWDSAVTYSLDTQVQHEGKQYYAQKDGTETPGTDPCTQNLARLLTTDESCVPQWTYKGVCKSTDPNAIDCSPYPLYNELVATGEVEPYKYLAGDKVQLNGKAYRATWSGGFEYPGVRFNMWEVIGTCKTVESPVIPSVDCSDIDAWSKEIAHGMVSPWTYWEGIKVTRDGKAYMAMWGGQEVPGTHTCQTKQVCAHHGWQWRLLGSCIDGTTPIEDTDGENPEDPTTPPSGPQCMPPMTATCTNTVISTCEITKSPEIFQSLASSPTGATLPSQCQYLTYSFGEIDYLPCFEWIKEKFFIGSVWVNLESIINYNTLLLESQVSLPATNTSRMRRLAQINVVTAEEDPLKDIVIPESVFAIQAEKIVIDGSTNDGEADIQTLNTETYTSLSSEVNVETTIPVKTPPETVNSAKFIGFATGLLYFIAAILL